MSESMIVGVDHGYAAMKTAHFSFPSGLVAYEHEPYTLKDVLEYGGKFYVVGSERQALQKNKTQTEDYYLLTLAAIAKELSFRHAETAAEIHLAAGLPLTSFGREKNAFRDYLLQDGKTVNFRYEGQEYSIAIRKVSLFPQGYAAMKTAHFSFPSGLVAYEHEPYTLKDVLEYGGKFYVVGSGRQALQKNKTQTEDYYLLTLAAIAKELSFRHAEPAAEIHLAAGLPLTSFGREKNAFREYLLRDGKTVNFRYEGQDYSIAIRKVSLFPQGYAAVLTQSILLDEPSVIVADIGGWTVDLMRLDNRIPNASTCRSLELGMIRCLDEIGEQIRRTLGLSMTAAQMESVLRGDAVHINEDARKIIDRQADAYVHRLLSAITESGLDTRAMPAVFLGGGAALLKRNVSAADGLCRPVILDDVSLNAKGYERLAERLSKNDEQ